MVQLRIGPSYWHPLNQEIKDKLISKYEVVIVSDEEYRLKLLSFFKVIGKLKEKIQ